MEAEVRSILVQAAQMPPIGRAFVQVARDVGGVDGLALPDRTDVGSTAITLAELLAGFAFLMAFVEPKAACE